MENNINKRVILITGDKNKWFEQAIFIVKKNTNISEIPVDFISEAERIIESYMSDEEKMIKNMALNSEIDNEIDNNAKKTKKSKKKVDIILNISMLCLVCLLSGMLMYIFFS